MKYFTVMACALALSACTHHPRTAAPSSTPAAATQTCAQSFNASVDRLVYALKTQNGVVAE